LLGTRCFVTTIASVVSISKSSQNFLLTGCSYNAAIFKIITISEYNVLLLEDGSSSINKTIPPAVERLDNSQWMDIYKSGNITRYGDLYLIVDEISYGLGQDLTNVSFDFADHFPMITSGSAPAGSRTISGWSNFSWWSDQSTIPGNLASVKPYRLHIKEGFATGGDHQSRIQISLPFMAVVVFFNFFKLAIMLGVLMTDRSEYIVTLGDAAASYLEKPEELTRGRSTLELDQMLRSFRADSAEAQESHVWRPRRRRYCSSIGYDKALSAIIA